LQGWLLATHWSPHWRKPSRQRKSQALPLQLGIPFAGAGHAVHELPHESTLRLSRQSSPHLWKPARQVKAQSVPLQLASAFAGGLQARHAGPQAFTSVMDTQLPPQSRWPPGQTPLQAWDMGMQAPAQSFVPPGQRLPQAAPSQVASPPVGTAQGMHEPPHVLTSVSLTHASPQR
jgi:hypothetical protein